MGAAALYQRGEIHRLRGEYPEAEEAFRTASQRGWDPQPGLALLRLTQGRTEVAAAAMQRALGTTSDRLQRTRLLPACIEVLLASGEIAQAREACRELEEIATSLDTPYLRVIAAYAHGAIDLAAGAAPAALEWLHRALNLAQESGLPYFAARTRMLMGLACCALGDREGGELELEAARAAFEHLGACVDCARLDAARREVFADESRELTRRELQVLRLVATGRTNKAIANELSLSEKTIDRHVSNIFTKLDVPTRAAATAYAFQHNLL
jgi:ATP/maltotriose-dependent transcriptional regulator MalT